MRTIEQAENIASSYLASLEGDDIELALLRAHTQEFDAGWVFFYQSKRFLQSGDVSDSLLGNAPIFVPRQEGPATIISYHRPYAESVSAFVACGNVNAEVLPQVALTGWLPGALAVQSIQLIRKHSALGLASAKQAVEDCLAGKPICIQTSSVTSARELVAELSQSGFKSELVWGG